MSKSINKNVIALGFVSFFTDMASSMVTTLLPIFVVYVLNDGVDKLGIVIAIATFISYIFRTLFGYISDRFGIVKPFVVLGYLISAVSKPMLAFTQTYASVAALRGVERMGKAVRSAPKDVLISTNVQNSAHGKTFGFHKMMDIAGEMGGAVIVFLLFYFFSRGESMIREIFEWTLVPGVLATLIVIFFVEDKSKVKQPKRAVIQKSDIKLLWPIVIYFLFTFFLMSEQFYIVKARESGFTLEMIPLLMITLTLVQTLTSYFSGILSDMAGLHKSLILSFFFAMISVALLQVNLWASFIFLGLFTVLSLNALRAYISRYAHSKAFVYGVLYGGIAIFSALGALAIGFIWEHFSFKYLIYFSEAGMGFMLLVLLIQYLLSQKSEETYKA